MPARDAAQPGVEQVAAVEELHDPLVGDHGARTERLVLGQQRNQPVASQPLARPEHRLRVVQILGAPRQQLRQERDRGVGPRRIGLQDAVPPAIGGVQRRQGGQQQPVAFRLGEPELAHQPRQPQVGPSRGGRDRGVDGAATGVDPAQDLVDGRVVAKRAATDCASSVAMRSSWASGMCQ